MSGLGRIAAMVAAAGAAALTAGCATAPEPAPPAARPEPPARQAPPAPTPQAPPARDLAEQDAPDPPLTAGEWSYSAESGGSIARFGPGGASAFSLRCDTGRRRIVLAREGSGAALRVRTTYGRRALPAAAELPADDPLLDEMAFSRGRFTVEADGLPPLIMPAWPEPARVIDDCRG